MDLQGPDFFDSRDPIFSDSKDLMIIFSDSRDPIFNSTDPNRVAKTPLKNPGVVVSSNYSESRCARMRSRTRAARSKICSAQTCFAFYILCI